MIKKLLILIALVILSSVNSTRKMRQYNSAYSNANASGNAAAFLGGAVAANTANSQANLQNANIQGAFAVANTQTAAQLGNIAI